jgi:hypothetical protein
MGIDMSKEFDYYIRRIGPTSFEVAKFESFGGDQPKSVYQISWDPKTQRGRCNCPAYVYRGKGVQDKHIQMVKKWVEQGDSFETTKQPVGDIKL